MLVKNIVDKQYRKSIKEPYCAIYVDFDRWQIENEDLIKRLGRDFMYEFGIV
jgi:hypothetical protein